MKKLLQISLITMSLPLSLEWVSASGTPSASQTAQATKQPQQGGKKLTCAEMGMLNAVLSSNPVGVMRMDLSYNAACKVLKDLPNAPEDKKYISGQIALLLEPVKQFFDIIQSYSGMIRPLVEESLLNIAPTDHTKHQPTKPAKKVYILDFFDSPKDAATYFDSAIQTKADLKVACFEFLTFFRDLKASLTADAIKAYDGLRQQLKSTSKAHH